MNKNVAFPSNCGFQEMLGTYTNSWDGETFTIQQTTKLEHCSYIASQWIIVHGIYEWKLKWNMPLHTTSWCLR